MRILIAEKETTLVEFIRRTLPQCNNRIMLDGLATDTDEALDRVRLTKPQLLLLDAQLPKKGGLYVLENIRTLSVSVIIISQNTHLSLAALRLGASDYLLKPFTDGEMQESIEKIYRKLYPGESLFS